MNCLPCFNGDDDDDDETGQDPAGGTSGQDNLSAPTAKPYTFRELAMSTKNFRQECLLGEGGFGRVFKGKLSDDQVVAVKQLDRNGMQENKEFVNEVMKLSRVHHPNLVNLIGYCADGDQRLLVYEYMSNGSLENHLFGDGPEPLNWTTRMKIAAGAAEGLQYLHESARPPIIYRDLKPSNILLNENYDPKLSDVGLAQLGPGGGGNNPASRVMGTYGYSAPEYSSNGELSLKSDVYSFGVVLLELITGRRAVDTTRPSDEQNLVTWAQPIFRDPKRFPEMADPQLNKHFPEKSLNQAVGIAAMCLQEESMVRPLIADIVPALSFICMTPPTVATSAATSEQSESSSVTPPPDQKMEKDINGKHDGSDSSSSRAGGNNRDNDDDKESQSDDRGSGESSSEEGNSKDGSNISTSSRSTRRSSPRAKKNSRQPMVTFKEPGSRYSTSSESDEGGGSSSKQENGSHSREGDDDSSSDD